MWHLRESDREEREGYRGRDGWGGGRMDEGGGGERWREKGGVRQDAGKDERERGNRRER